MQVRHQNVLMCLLRAHALTIGCPCSDWHETVPLWSPIHASCQVREDARSVFWVLSRRELSPEDENGASAPRTPNKGVDGEAGGGGAAAMMLLQGGGIGLLRPSGSSKELNASGGCRSARM
jgi:hypothetical protein